MISRQHRFHGLGSLRRVYQQGRSVRGPLLALKVLKNDRRREYRAAVVVSRKVNKSAVARNRLRRRVFEQLRLQADTITEPYDLVFTVFSEKLADLPPAELHKQINDLLEQAGIGPKN